MSQKRYFLFIDESGDHGLKNIDPDFPIFVLCGALFEEQNYFAFRDHINEVKESFLPGKEVILHSTDIRKKRKEFKVLLDEEIRSNFIEGINQSISNHDFTVFSSVIDKIGFIDSYGKLSEVYEISLSNLVERTVLFMKEQGLEGKLEIVLEKRGKKEDRELTSHFNAILDNGTSKVSVEDLKSLATRFHFRWKKDNVNGLQLADLLAYPIARQFLHPEKKHPSYEVFEDKFYFKDGKNRSIKKLP